MNPSNPVSKKNNQKTEEFFLENVLDICRKAQFLTDFFRAIRSLHGKNIVFLLQKTITILELKTHFHKFDPSKVISSFILVVFAMYQIQSICITSYGDAK